MFWEKEVCFFFLSHLLFILERGVKISRQNFGRERDLCCPEEEYDDVNDDDDDDEAVVKGTTTSSGLFVLVAEREWE